MSSFVADTWAFLTGRRDHPVYRHEMAGWSYLHIWHRLRRGCLPLMAVALVAPACCCGLVMLASLEGSSPFSSDWLLVPFAALIGLLTGGEIIRWLTGLLATALTSTVLSSEVEAETYPLLRVTPIPVREIVLAKFSASFQQFRLPLIVVALTRGLSALGILALGVIALLGEVDIPVRGLFNLSSYLSPLVTQLGFLTTRLASYGTAGVGVLLAVGIWFVYYLLAPSLSTLIFAAVGMLASSWARTRSGGLLAAAGLRVALWVASYIGGQLVSFFFSVLTLPFFMLTAPTQVTNPFEGASPILIVLGATVGAIIWALFLIAAQFTVALGMLYAASRRAERLA